MPRLMSPAIVSGSLSRSDQPSILVDGQAILRPWRITDAPAVQEAFRDPEIQRWHVRTADSAEEAGEWIVDWRRGWAAESDLSWALADRTSNAVLGRVSLKGVDHYDGSAGLAYWMMPAARGRGLCPLAVMVLCRWAFEEAGFHRIGLAHSTHNQASCRVAVKAGFREEGTRRRASLHADGWHDMHFHALLADDVQAV
jgi:[ribosomal protein S5]-alanine N-acetyltransferase